MKNHKFSLGLIRVWRAAGGCPHRFPHNNFNSVYQIFTKLGHMIPLWKGKNPIYFGVIRSKVKVTITINIIFDNRVTTLLSKILFIVSDLDLWPNDPKINMALPLPQGNHVAKFVKGPIYRTKVIVWKRPCYDNFSSVYWILTTWFPCGRGRTLFILGSLSQRSRSLLL
jgi:hypothetical protein